MPKEGICVERVKPCWGNCCALYVAIQVHPPPVCIKHVHVHVYGIEKSGRDRRTGGRRETQRERERKGGREGARDGCCQDHAMVVGLRTCKQLLVI